MAKRVLNRRQLRAEADQAARTEAPAGAEESPPAKPGKAAKAAKPPARAKKPRAKKEPSRLRARWGVFDNSMKRVAVFDYNQRAAADLKLAELNTRKSGHYFMQVVKEPIPEADDPQG